MFLQDLCLSRDWQARLGWNLSGALLEHLGHSGTWGPSLAWNVALEGMLGHSSSGCCGGVTRRFWSGTLQFAPCFLRWKRIYLQCRRPGFNPWLGTIPWRRAWLPTPVCLPGEFHEQRSLTGYSPRDRKASDMTEWLTCHFILALHSTLSRSFGLCVCLTHWIGSFL